MKLMTPEILERLKQNNLTKDNDHSPVVKYFTPWASATWLISNIDVDDGDLMFGLCDLGHGSPELGYVLLSDLEEIKGPYGLKVERDLHFKANRPMSEYVIAARAAQRIIEVG
jgi:hypothetical protein